MKLATFGVRAGTRALDTIAAAGARVGEKAVVADAGKFSDVLSAADRQHILYGDSPTSGGHFRRATPASCSFPRP